MNNPYAYLARKSIQSYLKSGVMINPAGDILSKMRHKKAGVFVSLHQKDGSLRGCIGTFLPTRENIAKEIISNAICAATQDPRFPSLSLKELSHTEISVDILSQPKLIQKNYWLGETVPKILDPKKFGLIVSTRDGRRGLLLPDIETVDTPEKQIKICCQKAGISPDEPISLEIFTVTRHSE